VKRPRRDLLLDLLMLAIVLGGVLAPVWSDRAARFWFSDRIDLSVASLSGLIVLGYWLRGRVDAMRVRLTMRRLRHKFEQQRFEPPRWIP
jgi:hypothetical protein